MRNRLLKLRQSLSKIFTRNGILFTAGLLGVAHETLLEHFQRPTLLILFAAMMGITAFLTPLGGDMTGVGSQSPDEPAPTRKEEEEQIIRQQLEKQIADLLQQIADLEQELRFWRKKE